MQIDWVGRPLARRECTPTSDALHPWRVVVVVFVIVVQVVALAKFIPAHGHRPYKQNNGDERSRVRMILNPSACEPFPMRGREAPSARAALPRGTQPTGLHNSRVRPRDDLSAVSSVADVAEASAVSVQMWDGGPQSKCRCGRGERGPHSDPVAAWW